MFDTRGAASTGPRSSWVLVLVAVLLAGLLPAAAVRAQSYEDRAMQEARDRIAAVERRLEEARRNQTRAADRLAELQADVAVLDQAVNAAADAVAQQEAEVARSAARLVDLEADGRRLEHALEIQVVALFKRGAAMRFETIFGAADVAGAIERAEFVRVLTSGEKALLESIRNSRILVEAQRERHALQQQRLQEYKAEQDELLARAVAARDEADSILGSRRAEVRALERQQDDLEADAEALRELIIQNSAAPTSGLAPSTAGYIWPICGVVTSGYGRRWGRMHEGIDIDGDTGDIIAAAKAGRVIFAGNQGGYGNLTLIDHGDGVVTAYAHQSRFFVGKGDTVLRGQKVGAVGNTGRSTGSHLHFETRVNGDPVDPRRFLNRGC